MYAPECAVEVQPGDSLGLITDRYEDETITPATVRAEHYDSQRRDLEAIGVDWDAETQIDVITLDQLVERYGLPSFCKIDVEGGEHIQNQQNSSHNYQRFPIGWITFAKPGRYKISVSCLEGDLTKASLKSIHFTPVV